MNVLTTWHAESANGVIQKPLDPLLDPDRFPLLLTLFF
jgi:hypothetical protein